jgi:2-haloacid dehalogenase
VTYGAVVFDVYGTLLDVTSVDGACAEVTSEPGALGALWRQKQLEYTWLRTLMGRYQDFWAVTGAALDHALDKLDVSASPEQRSRLREAWYSLEPFPEVADSLHRMRAWALAVLSNGTPEMLVRTLEHAGLLDRLSPVLSVDEVRRFKPDPSVYHLAEDRLGLPRAEILFVSANAWDAAGARAFGLPVAWVNRSGAPAEQLGQSPTLVVGDLAELADEIV